MSSTSTIRPVTMSQFYEHDVSFVHSVFGLNFNVNIYENFTKNGLYALGEQVYKRHIVFVKLGYCDGSNRRCRRHCYRPPDYQPP
jgi:hypothetical protein